MIHVAKWPWRGLRQLRRNRSGVAAIEFGLMLPVLTTLGMFGSVIGYMAMVNLQVSQLALSVADAGSRIAQTDNDEVAPTVTEADIDSVMIGAEKMGDPIDFKANGRVILSSLEKEQTSGKQFIHWQRCFGDLEVESDYGNDSDRNGLTGTPIIALGDGATKVSAPDKVAVMFVEVFYDYRGIFGTMFVNNMRFKQEAAYLVRDNRDLRQANESGVTGGNSKSLCT